RPVLAALRHPASHALAALRLPRLADDAGGHVHRRLARGGAPAAARIADAVLLPVGVIGMAGAELRGDLRVVPAALVGVADQQRDRCAGGDAIEHAVEDFDLVRLWPRLGVAGLA